MGLEGGVERTPEEHLLRDGVGEGDDEDRGQRAGVGRVEHAIDADETTGRRCPIADSAVNATNAPAPSRMATPATRVQGRPRGRTTIGPDASAPVSHTAASANPSSVNASQPRATRSVAAVNAAPMTSVAAQTRARRRFALPTLDGWWRCSLEDELSPAHAHGLRLADTAARTSSARRAATAKVTGR